MSEIINLIGIILGAGAIYGGIRADLKAMHSRIEEATAAVGRAHERMDRHVEVFHTKRNSE